MSLRTYHSFEIPALDTVDLETTFKLTLPVLVSHLNLPCFVRVRILFYNIMFSLGITLHNCCHLAL